MEPFVYRQVTAPIGQSRSPGERGIYKVRWVNSEVLCDD